MVTVKALVPLIDGFEEIEAVSVIDILRRADIDVTVAGVVHTVVTGSHRIPVTTDRVMAELDHRDYDLLVLPGGPGTTNLGNHDLVRERIARHAAAGKWIAAICAAPSILAGMGLLDGRTAACHPSVESRMKGANLTKDPVAVDGRFITSRGAGTAVPFALAIVGQTVAPSVARRIADALCVPDALR